MLTLPPIDTALRASGKTSEVVDTFTLSFDYFKMLEQVGSAYEKLKVKVAKQVTKFEEANKRREASHAAGKVHKEDSESSSSEEEEEKVEAG